MEVDIVTLQDIFYFKQEGFTDDGRIRGRFVASGFVPRFYDELQRRGIPVNMASSERSRSRARHADPGRPWPRRKGARGLPGRGDEHRPAEGNDLVLAEGGVSASTPG